MLGGVDYYPKNKKKKKVNFKILLLLIAIISVVVFFLYVDNKFIDKYINITLNQKKQTTIIIIDDPKQDIKVKTDKEALLTIENTSANKIIVPKQVEALDEIMQNYNK